MHVLRNSVAYLGPQGRRRQELRWLCDRRNLKEAEQDLQRCFQLWAHGDLPAAAGPSCDHEARIRYWQMIPSLSGSFMNG